MDFKSKEYRMALGLSLIVPILASMRSDNRIIMFLDTYTFLGLFMTLLGVLNSMRLHGSMDALQYSLRRSANLLGKVTYFDQPFEEYLREKEAERYGKKNVILSVGITILVFTFIMSKLYLNQ
ncbi:MAG: hypothetical protein E7191_04120 [Erysipelotrichaceae bacterium]|nr:hypothetical protein [Erysipelotrichaceae bacterium]